MRLLIFVLSVGLVGVQSYIFENLWNRVHVKHDVQVATNSTDWWETAVFYQIYPRSFMDSNNDGIGDLPGVTQKLPYLKDTGITVIWLSPIFKSPQVDQGYDISDYRAIHEEYGTLEDFTTLVETAHALGIKVLLDFVPNHSSNEHEWFIKSVAKIEPYKDYYIWHDGVPSSNPNATKNDVPNNWLSDFKGSAWEWNDERQQYYYHQFAVGQPDLNYLNLQLVEEMKDILRYWLDIGVDGFRIDAVPYLFEDPDFKDEELASGYTTYDVQNPKCLNHIYTKDLEATFDIIYQFREVFDSYSNEKASETKVMMTEAYSSIEKQMLLYGSSDGSKLGAHFTFNFILITDLTPLEVTVDEISNAINKWLAYIPEQYTSNWVLGNHDNHRVATRFGKENVDGFNMLNAILPGVMITYNGEEIGMENGEVLCVEGHDPQAIKNCTDEVTFQKLSRDFERTPFHWDTTVNAGFNAGAEPWLPVSSKANQTNVVVQNIEGLSSHYNVYKSLLTFRQNFRNTPEFDAVSLVKLSHNVLQIVRHRDNKEYSLLFNIGEADETVQIFKTRDSYKVVVASVGSSYKVGNYISSDLSLAAHESLIIENSASKVLPSLVLLFLYKVFPSLY